MARLVRFVPITRGAFIAFVILTLVNVGGFVQVRHNTKDLAALVKRADHEAYMRSLANCEAGNESRTNLLSAFDVLINAAEQNPNPNDTRTPEERQELIGQFRAQLQKQFPQRDCRELLRQQARDERP